MTPFDLIAMRACAFLFVIALVLYFATHRKPCKRFTVSVYFVHYNHILRRYIMSSVSIKTGKTAQAVAVAAPVDPAVALPTAVYAWSSSDTTIATVDAATGVVTAVAVGSALITASTTIDGVDGSGSAGVDVAAQGNQFTVAVTITPNA